ncbi:MAG: hypothetical protein BWY59_00045 [Verrucomicrobia bacterium ADurb.Bin345]|nr:MAG: hypothetical protein BWY59_00045 [Verrucomicrobia bacterium ADurb.Bin345]
MIQFSPGSGGGGVPLRLKSCQTLPSSACPSRYPKSAVRWFCEANTVEVGIMFDTTVRLFGAVVPLSSSYVLVKDPGMVFVITTTV